jgi:rubredoxin
LPTILIELSRKYFEELGNQIAEVPTKAAKKEKAAQDIHQCPECLTLYNSEYGDVIQGIEKGVLFKDLPEDYCCSLCESPKINFIVLAGEKLGTV